MTETYRVLIAGDHLVFASAHFITLEGGVCEPLHGHNYRARVTYTGTMNDTGYVVDFIALLRLSQQIVAELDHRLLVALNNPLLPVHVRDSQVNIEFQDRRWSVPLAECCLLDIANTTTELLAQYIAQKLLTRLAAVNLPTPVELSVEVEEGIGMWAGYRVRP